VHSNSTTSVLTWRDLIECVPVHYAVLVMHVVLPHHGTEGTKDEDAAHHRADVKRAGAHAAAQGRAPPPAVPSLDHLEVISGEGSAWDITGSC